MVVGAGAVEIAHSGSLRPCPVTVQTTVEPARHGAERRPAAAGRRRSPRCPARRTRRPRGPASGTPTRISRSVTARDQAARVVARVERLGPARRVADPDRGRDGRRLPHHLRRCTIGAAPDGLEPVHLRRARGVAGREVLAVAHPVGGDVAGVADRQAVDVGRVAERRHDLERGRLLAVQPVDVDRVDQRHRVVQRQLGRPAPGSRRSCRSPAAAGRRAPAPAPACRARSCPAARAPRR